MDGLVGMDASVPFYQATVDYWAQLQIDRVAKTSEFVRMIFKQPQEEAYFEKLTKAALRTPTNTVMTLIDNYILQDFRSLLPKIDVPTWVATVEGPRLSYMHKIQSMLPDSSIEIFKSAGHAIFVDQPEMFNLLLEKFILDLNSSRRKNSLCEN